MITAAVSSHGFSINSRDIFLSEYLKALKVHLREGELRDAFALLQQGIVNYPENALILSYFGFLQVVLEKRYRTGVENCRRALSLWQREALTEESEAPPELYLNLARAYIAAGRRKLAVECLEAGLRYDKHGELQKELFSIGVRRKPPVPFLDRSNPINKYLGMMTYVKKQDAGSFLRCGQRQ
jgi:tetratricopeptide (TPR) repeat protein